MSVASGRIAHYRLLQKLGEGGMGEVYLAEDTKLERQVALKVLPPDAASNPERLERFRREARAVAALSHPHIVTLYSVEEADGIHFLTMERVDGESLDRSIPAEGLPLKRLLEIAVALADALAAAHDKGVIHRDLKPANVMIGEKGRPKVLDFGLAKLTQARDDFDSQRPTHAHTREGVVMGTVPYMSPEQVAGRAVDPRTDIFSLGVMLYEMASGRRPFAGGSSAEIMSAILRDEPASLVEVKADLPAELARIIGQCLAKDPDQRFRSARELHDALAELREETASGARPSASARPLQSSSGGTITRWRSHWKAAAAMAALVIVGVLTAARFRDSSSGDVDSIAVLPFVNGDATPETDYLGEGISEGISNNLSQIQSLRVMARDSVRRYQGRQVEARVIGNELGVDAVLTGTITSRGDTLRIQAELVDTRTGAKLWGEQLTRKQGELMDLQDDVARQIFERLEVRLSGEQRQQVARRETADQAAYQSYLKGRYAWNQRTNDGYRKAIAFFREAIAADPNYARAYVGLADSVAFLEGGDVQGRDFETANGIIKKALQLDDSLGEAHATMGMLLQDRDWDLPGAEREFRRAVELSPNYATAHHWYAELLVQTGRFEEAFAQYGRALEVDPLSSAVASDLGLAYFCAGQFDRAIAQIQKTLRQDPKFFRAHHTLARFYAQVGRYREAADEHRNGWLGAGQDAADVARRTEALQEAFARSGARGYWRKRLEVELQASERETRWAHDVALLYAHLDDKDEAFAWLEKAYAARAYDLLYFGVFPEWAGLRSDPRYRDLARRIGVTPPS